MNHSFEERLAAIREFYEILDELEKRVGGRRKLAQCDGRMHWPARGVYFFFEPGEIRTTSGDGLRVVRVGTHALKEGSKSTLWKRLRQHKGQGNGGGNHRGSVFRHHVGAALIDRDGWSGPEAKNWHISGSAPRDIRQAEVPLERAVSKYICEMPFLWVEINDEPGPGSDRGFLERNAIALLSNFDSGIASIDPASDKWLGTWASSKEIQRSHLWNVNHVGERYDRSFFHILHVHVTRIRD